MCDVSNIVLTLHTVHTGKSRTLGIRIFTWLEGNEYKQTVPGFP